MMVGPLWGLKPLQKEEKLELSLCQVRTQVEVSCLQARERALTRILLCWCPDLYQSPELEKINFCCLSHKANYDSHWYATMWLWQNSKYKLFLIRSNRLLFEPIRVFICRMVRNAVLFI